MSNFTHNKQRRRRAVGGLDAAFNIRVTVGLVALNMRQKTIR